MSTSGGLGPEAVTELERMLREGSVTRRVSPGERAAENQRYVRDQVMRREPALAQALGGLLRDRNEHARECPQREPHPPRERQTRTRGRSR
jgi:hypothetical protein